MQPMIGAPEPISLRIDASTHCQLRCPSCPTAKGVIKADIGAGFLKPEQLEKLFHENPSVAHVELSNWGEIFLNPRLEDIVRIAFERNVALTASNGVNLNHAKRSALEAVVKYRVRHMTVSIDGASQETYEQYRIRGDFDRVIEHIELINEFKRTYKSDFPILLWQFVAFGHNEHEVDVARALAKRLGMHFYVKLAWDDFSPVQDKELIRSVTKSGASSREDYLKQYGEQYIQKGICRQLWDQPQINFDGEMLGCCTNRWGSLGNAFKDGLMATIDGEKMRYAKEMVTGQAEPRDDIPCTQCHHYQSMRERNDFLGPRDLKTPLIEGPLYKVARRFGRPFVRTANRSRAVSNWVLKPLADAIMSRMLE
jgi:MoaA/NifB/PqqE/SkfB family radical SAM enzyme